MYDYDYDYSLFEHKKSDTVKWVLTLVAFLIVGVMLAGIICGWFEKKEELPQEEQQEQQEQTDNGAPVTDENGEVIDKAASHPLPKAMAFRSATLLDGADAPYTSVTLTATVEPDSIGRDKVCFNCYREYQKSTTRKNHCVKVFVFIYRK